MEVKVNRDDWPVGLMPEQAMKGDAGFDLYVREGVVIEPHSFVDVDSGVAVALPEGTWGLITGRSSTLRKRGLLVAQGVIDNGYTGELFVGLWNLTGESVVVAPGDRLAQLIVLPLLTDAIELVEVSDLAIRNRGVNGFGSTGK